MRKNNMLILNCILLLVISSVAHAQEQIPPESLDRLQDVFSSLRDNLWEENDNFWHRGEYNRCIAMCRLITEIDPHDTEAFDDAAWLMQNDFKDDEAEVFLLKGLQNNLDQYDMFFSIGYFYYMHERFDEGVRYLEEACSFESPNFVRHLLAHAYEQAGYTDEAFNIWLQAEDIDPTDPVPHNQITRLMQGGPASSVPQNFSKMREARKAREMNSK